MMDVNSLNIQEHIVLIVAFRKYFINIVIILLLMKLNVPILGVIGLWVLVQIATTFKLLFFHRLLHCLTFREQLLQFSCLI